MLSHHVFTMIMYMALWLCVAIWCVICCKRTAVCVYVFVRMCVIHSHCCVTCDMALCRQLRRKSAADELLMRHMFVEGDVISVSVGVLFLMMHCVAT